MIKKTVLILFVAFVVTSCKKEKANLKTNDLAIKVDCDNDLLAQWSSETIEERKKDFVLAKNPKVIYSNENDFVEVIWRYDVVNPDLEKDEYIKYCVSLIEEKINISDKYKLTFDYILNASCPISSDLPIEVNSEIQNLSLIDDVLNTKHDFDIIRGRLDSAIKYVKDESGKVVDTIPLNF